jgi:gliding motility-associated-like protein
VRTEDCSCHLHIPNSFTPNNDQINEQFKIFAECNFKTFELTIFNRWGEIIYTTNNPEAAWDGKVGGKNVVAGSYSYKIIYQSSDPFDQEEHEILGGVTLLR